MAVDSKAVVVVDNTAVEDIPVEDIPVEDIPVAGTAEVDTPVAVEVQFPDRKF